MRLTPWNTDFVCFRSALRAHFQIACSCICGSQPMRPRVHWAHAWSALQRFLRADLEFGKEQPGFSRANSQGLRRLRIGGLRIG
eukprot:15438612-Alexandrium_andersonii.AAC.1